MKKFFLILAVVLTGVFVFSSCKARQKCAAYGHYTYYEVTTETGQNQ